MRFPSLLLRSVFSLVLGAMVSVSTLLAQTADQTGTVSVIKADNSKVWAQAEGPSAAEALAAARLQLTESARLKYRNLETAIENAFPETEDTQKLAKLKVDLKSNSIEWAIAVKKKPTVFVAFVYVDVKDARKFVMDRALAFIKSNKKLKWGEAFGESAEKAITGSKENLISQISLTIETATSLSTTEQSSGVSETFQNRTRAFSKMTLQGVQTISPIDLEGTFYTLSYISSDDLEKSFAPVKARVLTAAEEGQKYEAIGNIQAALQNYYKAYLYADGYYTAMPYKFKGQDAETPDIRAGLKARIEQVLGTMSIRLKPAYELGEELISVPFEVFYNNVRVSGVNYEVNVGGNVISDRVRGGRGRLELSRFEPSDRTEMFDVRFGVDISEDLQRDTDLQMFEPVRRIRMLRNVEADFSNIFKVNIEATFQGADVFFQAKTKNIAALAGKWNFGDGEESTDLNPKHTYTTDGVFKVELFVNGDTTLKDVKYVYLKDQQLRRTKKEELNSTATAMLLAPVQAALTPVVETVAEVKKDSVATPAVEVKVEEKKDSVAVKPPEPAPAPANLAPPEMVETKPAEPLSEAKIFEIQKNAAKAKDAYEELRYIEITSQLERVLTRMKRAGEFIIGQQKDLPDADGAMVIIADRKNVVDKLVFSQNRYMSLVTGQEITDLKTRYSGKSIIWIQAAVKE